MAVPKLERRILILSTLFALVLFSLAALAVNVFHVGLPTCLTDIKPFQKGELITHSPEHYEIHYIAKMWKFEPEEVTVPAGSNVDLFVSTPDVTHGLIILGTNANLMVVPGVVNYTRLRFDKPGVHQLLCHEFCGTGHDRMSAILRVVDRASFHPTAPPLAGEPADPRYKLLEAKDCTTCHTIDGEESIGPTLKGIYGRQVKLTDGSTVTADDAYLREAIMKPSVKITAGYQDQMPVPELTDAELTQIIEYLKTLK